MKVIEVNILSIIGILETLSDGSVAVKCGFCSGNGLFPEMAFDDPDEVNNEPCPVCKGVGINIFKTDKERLFICKLCDGSGASWDKDGYFVGDTCPTCKGKGIVVLGQPENFSDIWTLMHPEIVSVSKSRYNSGHFADSVEAAFKHVNSKVKYLVKQKSGKELDGAGLMTTAFSLDNPILELGDLSTESGRNIQKGYMQIFAGSIIGIRNPRAHENHQIDKNQAIHLLFLASLLVNKLENRGSRVDIV